MNTVKIRIYRKVAAFLMVCIIAETLSPTIAYALTSGPQQPEFSSFEPVATTNMVDPFTGGFTYNLPVLNVPGPNGSDYGMSLSYHNNTTMEEEASWVGYGWTLNPGAINRNVKGFPDDYNGAEVQNTVVKDPNYTISSGVYFSPEIASLDLLTVKAGLTFNNYRGFSHVFGASLGILNGLATLSYSVSETGHSFELELNPAKTLEQGTKLTKKAFAKNTSASGSPSEKEKKVPPAPKDKKNKVGINPTHLSRLGSHCGIHAFNEDYRALVNSKYQGIHVNVSMNFMVGAIPIHMGPKLGFWGSLTTQFPKSHNIDAYGYLYSGNAVNNSDRDGRAMDYTIENPSDYNKRDMYLPIPYNSADMFSVSGEGLGGSFRFHSARPGHFYPTFTTSFTAVANLSFEMTYGLNIEPLGFTVGGGAQVLYLRNWVNQGNTNYDTYKMPSREGHIENGTENYFLRYDGDKGGGIVYTEVEGANRAHLEQIEATIGLRRYAPKVNDIHTAVDAVDPDSKPNNSNYVGYTTNARMNDKITVLVDGQNKDVYFRSQTRDAETRNLSAGKRGDLPDGIGEIYSINQAGAKYVYGLPVYNNYEYTINYKLDNVDPAVDVVDNRFYYHQPNLDMDKTISERRNTPYAASHLLTQINTPDYIDRTFDGPTPDDFGGYTKFAYDKAYGTTGLYNWRFPYNGYMYSRNTLSDNRDDYAMENAGGKEMYYLKAVETKTHIAYFVTDQTKLDINYVQADGTTATLKLYGTAIDPVTGELNTAKARRDGLGAAPNAEYYGAKNLSQRQRKLERVILYAKNADGVITGKPLKIVHLAYENPADELIQGTPNNATGNGKLTLKKVWFEYEGIVNSKISPYEFKYAYKTPGEFSANITAKYPDIVNYKGNKIENPNYSATKTDSWGNYRPDGGDRRYNMRPWVSQRQQPTSYDPAAWQLKQIKLPSGGEILVQYEEHEYQYVQDQRATTMVSLINSDQDPNNVYKDEEHDISNRYYINLVDAGVDPNNAAQVNKYLDQLNAYLTNDNKLYFKFLYNLTENQHPNLDQCHVEYIDGYSGAGAHKDDAGHLYVSFANPGVGDQLTMPRQVCLDLVHTSKNGINNYSNCKSDRIPSSMSLRGAVDMVRAMATSGLRMTLPMGCYELNIPSSYVKLPTFFAKKGGGTRVKRLLMYDKGIETGDEMIYGSEYQYVNEDGITSSGVATNEPPESREENAVIDYLDKRSPQRLIGKIISGIDKENFEGPLGEYLLPGASIGYSRVIVKNIHQGKTSVGYTVHEYYTCRDFPFNYGWEATPTLEKSDYLPIPMLVVDLLVNNRWVSQGYKFMVNEMHGKAKRVATYSLDVTKHVEGQPDESSMGSPSFEEVYEYYKPGEKVQVLLNDGTYDMRVPGMTQDITMEMKSVDDVNTNLMVQVDPSIGLLVYLTIPQLSFMPYIVRHEKRMRTHVINKVVHCPAILKKTTTTRNSIVHTVYNKTFSAYTGEVVVKVEADEFEGQQLLSEQDHKGIYTSYSLPSSYVYPEMGPVSMNQNFHSAQSVNLQAVDASNGRYKIVLSNSNPVNSKFVVIGDLIHIDGLSSLFYIDGINGSVLDLQSVNGTTTVTGNYNGFTVVNSGYANRLTESIATISTYGSDLSNNNFPPQYYVGSTNQLQAPLGTTSKAYEKVLGVSVYTMSQDWSGNSTVDQLYGLSEEKNDYQAGRKGKWRPLASYVLKTNVTQAADYTVSGNTVINSKIYDKGMIENFPGFNFYSPPNSGENGWIRSSLVTAYSPHGSALEEKNSLNIYNTAVYGYKENLPVALAQNATLSSVGFYSFEDDNSDNIDITTAHTGSNSLKISSTIKQFSLKMIPQYRAKGLQVRLWMKSSNVNPENTAIWVVQNYTNAPAKVVARSGDWILVEYELNKAHFVNINDGTPLDIYFSSNQAGVLWLDDIRIQPMDASMACYVYDKNSLKMLATFDDQHFAMIYQYNAEGKLVRKLIETERGIKTVTEATYNTPIE